MYKTALIIDAQVDFMRPEGALYVPGAEETIEIINDYLGSVTMENGYFGSIFTADTHNAEDYPKSEEAETFPPHCYVGTDGFDFAIEPQRVSPELLSVILNKDVFNMWEAEEGIIRPFKRVGDEIAIGGNQDRDVFFKNLISAGVTNIEVSGVASDYCVKWAIEGLLVRDFNVIVYDNLVAGIEKDIHEVAEKFFFEELEEGRLSIL